MVVVMPRASGMYVRWARSSLDHEKVVVAPNGESTCPSIGIGGGTGWGHGAATTVLGALNQPRSPARKHPSRVRREEL